MVKNTFGGNKAKGFARKNTREFVSNKLRMSECPEEKYAFVQKLLGNACDVFCDDYVARLGMIPGKFSGRNKRNNSLATGTLVLIGLRTWASVVKGKKEKCDILEVYTQKEIDQLRERPNFPTAFLEHAMREYGDSEPAETYDTTMYAFTDEQVIPPEMSAVNPDLIMDTGEEIDFDEI
jgi:hypothetical protein